MRRMSRAASPLLIAVVCMTGSLCSAAGTWCLGFDHLGPVRAGLTVEQVLALADFSGMERRQPAATCWYLRYEQERKGSSPAFRLMIIDGRVARIELVAGLATLSGARIGSTEAQLRQLYGDRLEVQPHKYDENGHTLTWRSGDGASGLRFETSGGKVTAIQAGPWEHLNYVEGCS